MIYPVISVQQPWPEAMFILGKDIENRSWKCPLKYLSITILLHAGKEVDKFALACCSLLHGLRGGVFQTGGIVGAFRILSGTKVDHDSDWAETGCFNWEIADARRVPFFPCRGRLGFFEVDYPYMVPVWPVPRGCVYD